MYSFLGGGLVCAGVGNILLVVSTATDYWMQYRQASGDIHQGLWRYCVPGKCMIQPSNTAYLDGISAYMILAIITGFLGMLMGIAAFINYNSVDGLNGTFLAALFYYISFFSVLPAMAVYTGVIVFYYGKRYENWRFSWSYIMGWVSVVLTFFAGIFHKYSILHLGRYNA
ncbi:lens fiber membrane intrinsic protein-like [Tachysurus vachellii]|uniref:lens fiber membrane intrinsic protein-like n=1 Tax=Tachysurus vachellii TaxID=175792 RepID=UPI00296B1C56|nr:lens fiber membrane intrinsic protein-like [Tachysurus vachellii]